MEKQQINGGDSIDYSAKLCGDLLMEIFSRLPTKSLFRLKSVSKAWYSLVSNHSIQRRLELAMSGLVYQILPINLMEEPVSACISGVDGVQNTTRGFRPSSLPNFRIIDCCNNLLLCLSIESEEVSHYVCNPVTKEYILLPKPHEVSCLDNARLVFDPNVSSHFKVIGVSDRLRLFSSIYIMLEIFSSDDGKWVKSKVLSGRIAKTILPRGAVYLNGTLNMLGLPRHVVGIDVEVGCQTRISLPSEKYNDGLLGKCRGYLCYIVCDGSSLRAWMLEDYSRNEWILKYTIRTQTIQEKLLELSSPLSVSVCAFEIHILALHSDFEIVFFETNSRLFAYDLASTRLVEICAVMHERGYTHCFPGKEWFRAYPFTPCQKIR